MPREKNSKDIDEETTALVKSYKIPRKEKPKENKEFIIEISSQSVEYQQEILPTLRQNYYNRFDSEKNYHYIHCYAVNNKEALSQFEARRKELKDLKSHTDKDLVTSYAFLEARDLKEARTICKEGLLCGNRLFGCLGQSNSGIYLSRHSDVTTAAPQVAGGSGVIMIFKIVKGRIKYVPIQSFHLEPTPNFDCHMARFLSQELQNASPLKLFEASQIYLYEYDDTEVCKKLKLIYPIAFLTYDYGSPMLRAKEYTVWAGSLNCGLKCPIQRLQLMATYGKMKPFSLGKTLQIQKLTSFERVLEWQPITDLRSDMNQPVSYKRRHVVSSSGMFVTVFRLNNDTNSDEFDSLINKLYSHKAAALSTLRNGNVMILLPMGELTDQIGIPRYSDSFSSLHCIVVGYTSCVSNSSVIKDPYDFPSSHQLLPPAGCKINMTKMKEACEQLPEMARILPNSSPMINSSQGTPISTDLPGNSASNGSSMSLSPINESFSPTCNQDEAEKEKQSPVDQPGKNTDHNGPKEKPGYPKPVADIDMRLLVKSKTKAPMPVPPPVGHVSKTKQKENPKQPVANKASLYDPRLSRLLQSATASPDPQASPNEAVNCNNDDSQSSDKLAEAQVNKTTQIDRASVLKQAIEAAAFLANKNKADSNSKEKELEYQHVQDTPSSPHLTDFDYRPHFARGDPSTFGSPSSPLASSSSSPAPQGRRIPLIKETPFSKQHASWTKDTPPLTSANSTDYAVWAEVSKKLSEKAASKTKELFLSNLEKAIVGGTDLNSMSVNTSKNMSISPDLNEPSTSNAPDPVSPIPAEKPEDQLESVELTESVSEDDLTIIEEETIETDLDRLVIEEADQCIYLESRPPPPSKDQSEPEKTETLTRKEKATLLQKAVNQIDPTIFIESHSAIPTTSGARNNSDDIVEIVESGLRGQGLLIPDDLIFVRTSTQDAELILNMFYQKHRLGTADWIMKVHSQMILKLAESKKNLDSQSAAYDRVTRLLVLLTRFRNLGRVQLLSRHECDLSSKASKDYLSCISRIKRENPEKECVFLSNLSSTSTAAKEFFAAGINVCSVQKFIDRYLDA